MHPRPGYNLGPRPKHGLGVSSPRGESLGPSGMPRCSPATSGALGRRCQPDPQGHGHTIARRNAVGSPVAHPTPQRAGPPWPGPSLSFLRLPGSRGSKPQQGGPGPLPGTTTRSQDPTGTGRRRRARGASSSVAPASPRGPAPAPTPAAPELRLMRFSQPRGSFSSSAIFPPAAAPAPPPPHCLCRLHPPTTAANWLGAPCTRVWRRRPLGTLLGLMAFYWSEARVGVSYPPFFLPGLCPLPLLGP